jgi:hypothetical protein
MAEAADTKNNPDVVSENRLKPGYLYPLDGFRGFGAVVHAEFLALDANHQVEIIHDLATMSKPAIIAEIHRLEALEQGRHQGIHRKNNLTPREEQSNDSRESVTPEIPMRRPLMEPDFN